MSGRNNFLGSMYIENYNIKVQKYFSLLLFVQLNEEEELYFSKQ